MTLKSEYLERCVRSLEHALGLLGRTSPDSIDYDVFRNAAIKSFELSLETSGKLLQKVLRPYFASPKEVDRLVFKDLFRQAAKHGILSVESVERWLQYRDNRNNTAHDYGESFANETLKLLSDFVKDAKDLAEIIERREHEPED